MKQVQGTGDAPTSRAKILSQANMNFFVLFLCTPVYDCANVTTGTTEGNNNYHISFLIIIVTDWLGGIVEWDDQEGVRVDSEHGIHDDQRWKMPPNITTDEPENDKNAWKYSWWQKYNQQSTAPVETRPQHIWVERVVFFSLWLIFLTKIFFTNWDIIHVDKKPQQPKRFFPSKHTNTSNNNNKQLLVGPWRGDEVAKLQILMPSMSDFWHWQHQPAPRNGGWEKSSHPWKKMTITSFPHSLQQ